MPPRASRGAKPEPEPEFHSAFRAKAFVFSYLYTCGTAPIVFPVIFLFGDVLGLEESFAPTAAVAFYLALYGVAVVVVKASPTVRTANAMDQRVYKAALSKAGLRGAGWARAYKLVTVLFFLGIASMVAIVATHYLLPGD